MHCPAHSHKRCDLSGSQLMISESMSSVYELYHAFREIPPSVHQICVRKDLWRPSTPLRGPVTHRLVGEKYEEKGSDKVIEGIYEGLFGPLRDKIGVCGTHNTLTSRLSSPAAHFVYEIRSAKYTAPFISLYPKAEDPSMYFVTPFSSNTLSLRNGCSVNRSGSSKLMAASRPAFLL